MMGRDHPAVEIWRLQHTNPGLDPFGCEIGDAGVSRPDPAMRMPGA
jgi:hypothetical protein